MCRESERASEGERPLQRPVKIKIPFGPAEGAMCFSVMAWRRVARVLPSGGAEARRVLYFFRRWAAMFFQVRGPRRRRAKKSSKLTVGMSKSSEPPMTRNKSNSF